MSINPNTVLEEIASEKVTLICGRHNYVASRRRGNHIVAIPPQPNGCKQCWMNYYTTDLALTPPSKRQERLDELESVIHHAIEFERTGKFGKDFELYEPNDKRFTVAVQKDAADDETGQDKITDPNKEEIN